jgi:hypothetical protein
MADRSRDPDPPAESAADQLRRMYSYKRMILRGKLKLPHQSARKLIGPDCAYHLYHNHKASDNADDDDSPRDAD